MIRFPHVLYILAGSNNMIDTKTATMPDVIPVPSAASTATQLKEDDASITRPKTHFSLLGAIGVQYSVTSAPIAIGTYMSLAIGLGGSPAYFWGFFMVGFLQLAVCLAAAELASAIPHSSGMYPGLCKISSDVLGPAYWAVVLASPRYARNVSYLMGWLTNAGWFLICAASCLYPAQITMGLIEIAHPGFVATPWQTYLLYVAYALLYLIINLPRIFHTVNWLLRAVVFAVNGTAIYLLIGLLVRVESKQTARFVFVDFVNESGWSSNGTVFFLALLPAMSCLAGFDNVTHLTDELENPKKQVPQVLLGSFVMSYLTSLPMIIVYEFCNVDPTSLLAPAGGQPIIQLIQNAFRSFAMVAVGTSMILFCFSIAGTSALISWSRLYWSFSRVGALPFSRTMSKLSSRDALPIHALCWNTVLLLAIGAISIGSTTAMNALLGAANLCLLSSFAIVFGLALHRGRKTLDPDRYMNLGRWGDAIFWVSTLWLVLMSVMFCIPLYLPVTLETMNWTSVVYVGVIVISGIYWLVVFSRNPEGL